MSKATFPKPLLLSTSEEVSSFCKKLQKEKFITIDTEFVRERTYWPQLCLVQLGGAEDIIMIDACAKEIDLSPLADLLAHPDCIKVFHAARQDLEIFLHLFDVLPVNIFDTQIAAMVAGFGEQVGYDSLVASLTGRVIDKSHRFSDWAARPLTKAQLDYASADVTHLRDVYQLLCKELKEKQRLSWVNSELETLTELATFRPNPRRLWEKLKVRTHNRRVLGILQELARWRELEAQNANLPRQRVIRDESLLEIAVVRPKETQHLLRIRGITQQFAEGRWGRSLLEAIARGEALAEEELPFPLSKKKAEKPKISQGVLALLKVLLMARSEEHKVASRLIISNDDLERLILGERDLNVLKTWRYELFGREALLLLEGKVSFHIEGDDLSIAQRECL